MMIMMSTILRLSGTSDMIWIEALGVFKMP
jgi:hypothetical protein